MRTVSRAIRSETEFNIYSKYTHILQRKHEMCSDCFKTELEEDDEVDTLSSVTLTFCLFF